MMMCVCMKIVSLLSPGCWEAWPNIGWLSFTAAIIKQANGGQHDDVCMHENSISFVSWLLGGIAQYRMVELHCCYYKTSQWWSTYDVCLHEKNGCWEAWPNIGWLSFTAAIIKQANGGQHDVCMHENSVSFVSWLLGGMAQYRMVELHCCYYKTSHWWST